MQFPTVLINGYVQSGISWLLNCLVELGIRFEEDPEKMFIYHGPHSNTHSQYLLSPEAEPCKPATPALFLKDRFIFRNDVLFIFNTHCYPRNIIERYKRTIFIIRDPRDVLWSHFNFEDRGKPFYEWLSADDNKEIMLWKNFHNHFISHPNIRFFRFEDYKNDAAQHLKNILSFANVTAPENDIEHAVFASSSDKAKEAEALYRQQVPEEKRYHKASFRVRKSMAQEWRTLPEYADAFKLIEKVTYDLMQKFNYECYFINKF